MNAVTRNSLQIVQTFTQSLVYRSDNTSYPYPSSDVRLYMGFYYFAVTSVLEVKVIKHIFFLSVMWWHTKDTINTINTINNKRTVAKIIPKNKNSNTLPPNNINNTIIFNLELSKDFAEQQHSGKNPLSDNFNGGIGIQGLYLRL